MGNAEVRQYYVVIQCLLCKTVCPPPVSWDWHPLRPYLFIFYNVWKHYEYLLYEIERAAQIRCSFFNIIHVRPCVIQQVLSISITPHDWSSKACVQTLVILHKFVFGKSYYHTLNSALWKLVPLKTLWYGKKRQEECFQNTFKLRGRCWEFYLGCQSIGNLILTLSGSVSHFWVATNSNLPKIETPKTWCCIQMSICLLSFCIVTVCWHPMLMGAKEY